MEGANLEANFPGEVDDAHDGGGEGEGHGGEEQGAVEIRVFTVGYGLKVVAVDRAIDDQLGPHVGNGGLIHGGAGVSRRGGGSGGGGGGGSGGSKSKGRGNETYETYETRPKDSCLALET